jgi:hypothetical protein
MPDEYAENSAALLFGGRTQERYDDPEGQGGKIALIAFKQNIVQKTPNSLGCMHASLPKQVAYNQRILKAGQEIDGINCDLADFPSRMSLDRPEDTRTTHWRPTLNPRFTNHDSHQCYSRRNEERS